MKYIKGSEGLFLVKEDYSKKVIFQPSDFVDPGHQMQVVIIPPHTKQRLHSHNKQTEVFYILEGETTITINTIDYSVKPGDAFICSPGDIHNLWNKSNEEFKLLVFKINYPSKEEDTDWQNE